MSIHKTKNISSTGIRRLLFLDIMKGYAVFFFILWHVFQNFYQYDVVDSPLYRLSFPVTGFFVFASGFLVGCKYFEEQINKEKFILSLNRLAMRAFKLIIIVFVANIAIQLIYEQQSVFVAIEKSFIKILSLLYMDRWDVSLQVLLAISFTLVFGYLLLYIEIVIGQFCVYSTILLLFLVFFYDLSNIEPIPYLWRYFIHGIAGITYGIIFRIYIISKKMKMLFGIIASLSLLIFFFIEISIIVYSSLYNFYLYTTSISVLASASCFIGFSLILFYIYDINNMSMGNLLKIISLVGVNSLFVYIMQIVVIDIISLLHVIVLYKQIDCALLSIAIFLLTVVFYKIVEKARYYQPVDAIYKMIFQ